MLPILREFVQGPITILSRLLRETEFRNYEKLRLRLNKTRRFTERNVKIHGWSLSVPDCASFLSGYRSIFVEGLYTFSCSSEKPYIVDLGANIGLSVLFFKNTFPGAEITALEADPVIFGYLQRNIHGNGFHDVTLVNKAAWHENTVLTFMSEGADGGRISSAGDGHCVEVPAMDASGLISGKKVDFLKMDIEGAEINVLMQCREYLPNVSNLFIEYHSRESGKQELSVLLEILEQQRFRYHIHSMLESQKPFLGLNTIAGYDMLLNIFAWKE